MMVPAFTHDGAAFMVTIESPLVSKIQRSRTKARAKEKASPCDEASVVFAPL